MRLTAYASGRVQQTGYRARVIEMARAFGLRGFVQNLDDGRVKIVAEGEEPDLRRFADAVKIRDSLINVVSFSEVYSPASGDFDGFYKLVEKGETDERLDRSAVLLKELIVVVKDGFSGVNGKLDTMIGKQDQALGKLDKIIGKQDDLIDEVRGARSDLKSFMESNFERIEGDISDLKGALRAKGLI